MLVWLPFRVVGKNIGSRAICATRSPVLSVPFASKAGENTCRGAKRCILSRRRAHARWGGIEPKPCSVNRTRKLFPGQKLCLIGKLSLFLRPTILRSFMSRLKKLKKIRLHREGTTILVVSFLILASLCAAFYFLFDSKLPFYVFGTLSLAFYLLMVNFFRCPIRVFDCDTEKIVVAPADGRIVVIEEVDEHEYFHDRRLMVSIFMSVVNVHANWYPVDGVVKLVRHHSGNFMKAWLPKASTENERSTIVIETPEGVEILTRQIAGAVARRIVTYAKEGEECYIDEHMGFIKFGSRVDVYLPLGTEVCVKMGQLTTGNQTVLAKLK